MVAPKAAVGDGEGGIFLTFFIGAGGKVAGGQVRPVVVFVAFGRGDAELAPPGFGAVGFGGFPLGV